MTWLIFSVLDYCVSVRLQQAYLTSLSNGIVSIEIYDKRDDFDFDRVNFPFLDGDVPRRTSYGVNICQLIVSLAHILA